ncbi:MAG: hypothetical protein KDB53_19465, partial [Planctomycetes bacterium]|nr:hypothetical protein [Planctomycetota bacterium]
EQVQTSVQFRTNDFEKGNFAVPVIATIVGPIMVTPHRVLLQGQKRSEPFTKQIQLGPREEGFGFNLTALELVDVPPELGLSVEMLPPNDARPGWVVLSLKGYAPSSPTGPDGFVVRGAVLVRTDAAAQPELRIPLEGTFVLP